MIPSEIFAEDMMSTIIRYGLYIGAAFQLVCLLASVTLTDDQSEPYPYEKVLFYVINNYYRKLFADCLSK